MKKVTKKLENLRVWLIDLLGGYTREEIFVQRALFEEAEKEKMKLIVRNKRVEELLVGIVSSFHNFNFCNFDFFPEHIRIIIRNIRLFTNYLKIEDNNLQKLNDDEFKELINLLDNVLHKAILEFRISNREVKEFNSFFYQIKEKYGFDFFIIKDLEEIQ